MVGQSFIGAYDTSLNISKCTGNLVERRRLILINLYSLKNMPMHANTLLKSAITLAVAQSLSPNMVSAASIEVGPGCTLSQAITSANTDAVVGMCSAGVGADTITLPAESLIELTEINLLSDGSSGLPTINSEITIQGQGSTVQRGDFAPDMRLLHIVGDGQLTLNSLTLRNGLNTMGSAILADHATKLNILNSTIRDNSIQIINTRGNGVTAFDTDLRIENSLINENNGQGQCGVYLSGGNLDLIDSQVVDNDCPNGSAGILLDVNNLVVQNSTVSRNTARFNAGLHAGEVTGGATIVNSHIDNNIGSSRSGVVLSSYYGANVNIADTTINQNIGGAFAGIGVFYGDNTSTAFSVTMDGVTVSDNRESSSAGVLLGGDVTVNITGGAIERNQGSRQSGLGISGYQGYGWTARGSVKDITISDNTGHGRTSLFAGLRAYQADLELTNVTISSGLGSSASAIHAQDSVLQIKRSRITDNTSTGPTILIQNAGSRAAFTDTLIMDNISVTGGIRVEAADEINIHNSTLAGNTATNSGGALNLNTVANFKLSNSTLSGNQAGSGGALYLQDVAQTDITNVTFSGNSGSTDGATMLVTGTSSTPRINNSVFANAGLTGHCSAVFSASAGINNWFDDASCTGLNQGPALLSDLADNGGPTPTHQLLPDSPLIDSGDVTLCNQAPISGLDQRREPRGEQCDIGAFELAKGSSSFYVIPLKNGRSVVIEL